MKFIAKLFGVVLLLALVAAAGAAFWILQRTESLPGLDLPSDGVVYVAGYESPAIESTREILTLLSETNLPSMSMAVGIDGELVWTLAAGYADVASRTPASAATRYRVGSVAKPYTTVAMGTLLEEGALALDDPFNKWVPEFPQKSHPFSLRQLASHQAGVRHYHSDYRGIFETYHQTQYNTVADAMVLVQDDPLRFEPGTSYLYSSYGYNMLSLALERAAGEDFLSLMQQRVFDPAGMTSTIADHQDRDIDNVATPYLLYEDVVVRQPDVNNSYKWAGGGFLSTPADMIHFANALMSGSVISRDTRSLLWTPQTLKDGSANPEHYALGFHVLETERGVRVFHGGGSVGGSSYLMLYPGKGASLAFATNTTPVTLSRNIRAEVEDVLDRFVARRAEMQNADPEDGVDGL